MRRARSPLRVRGVGVNSGAHFTTRGYSGSTTVSRAGERHGRRSRKEDGSPRLGRVLAPMTLASTRVLIAALLATVSVWVLQGAGAALAAHTVRGPELGGGPSRRVRPQVGDKSLKRRQSIGRSLVYQRDEGAWSSLLEYRGFGGSAWNDSSGAARLAPLVLGAKDRYNHALQRAGIEPYSSHPSGTKPYAVCPPPSKERFSCLSVALPRHLASASSSSPTRPQLEGSGELGGYSPADLRSAYRQPSTGGKGVTVAITIAYDYPKAESDLAVYRETYGLPPCTSSEGCFQKVNQEGRPEDYPEPRSGWAGEAALDLDMVSAMCPECKILLVEANDDTDANLPPAVNTAAALGANVISDSWDSEEFPEETSLDADVDHPGIPVLFASGDAGFGGQYPASSPDVIAVGGSSLRKDRSARGWRETAWEGSGSNCSAYEEKPAWQIDTGCTKRTVADVSAVADPETPVSVYDSYGPYEGWELFGGTSVATPLLAGIEAHTNATERSEGAALFWQEGPEGRLNDITEGRNGPCRPEPEYLCLAGFGYDGPSGWGSPGAIGRPAAPVVASNETTGVSEREAMLGGAINPNGEQTSYRFEYGPSSAYGASVPIPDANAGAGTSPTEVSEQLTGLTPDATYHYRLVASNSLGSTYSGDHTFVTSPWTAQYMPRKRPQREEMFGVSCASVSFCMSVGEQGVFYEPPELFYNGAPLVEQWNGTAWVRDPAPVYHQPADGFASRLEAVSCDSSSSCMAIGENYEIHVGYGPLVERWDGNEWSLLPAPIPSEAGRDENGTYDVRPHDVTCTSPSFCVLVGEFTRRFSNSLAPNEVDTLIEQWDGSSWSVQASPNPPGGSENLLWSVSCVSSSSCVAVGESRQANHSKDAFIERWNGSTWSIDASPTLSGGLRGISCTAETACMAVGGTEGHGTEGHPAASSGIAEAWNGSSWNSAPLREPMRGVSCTAQNSCVAVGGELDHHQAYAEHWNGSEWSKDLLGRPPEASDEPRELNGVSCAPTACIGVGWYWSWGYAPLAELRPPISGPRLKAPEFGTCVKVTKGEGEYANAKCTQTGGKDNYEWVPEAPAPGFTSTLTSSSVTLETVKGSTVACTGETSTGDYTGSKTVGAVVLTLTGCQHNNEDCSSGATAGQLVSSPLEGVLGVEKLGATDAKNKIALELFATEKTKPIMEVSCGDSTVTLRGSVIVPITSNKMSLAQVFKFKATRGKQKPESFAGEAKDVLEASFNGQPVEQTGLTLTTTQTSEDEVEVNSVY